MRNRSGIANPLPSDGHQPPTGRLSGRRIATGRRGASLSELMVTVAIAGVLTTVTMPRMHQATSGASVRTTKIQVGSYLQTARAAAVQRGVDAVFHDSLNVVWVTVGTDTVVRPTLIDQTAVSQAVVPALGSIDFDARGVAQQLTQPVKFRFTSLREPVVDSLCVSAMGATLRQCGA